MFRRMGSGIIMILLLTSTLIYAFSIQSAKAAGTIYIRADGSVDPPTAPISAVDNVTYIFTANIFDPIVVERDDIIVNGDGYTVQGPTGGGISLTNRRNVTIRNMEIKSFFHYGISLYESSNNVIAGNNITDNQYGVFSVGSSNNSISRNNITGNTRGIDIKYSSNNNTISNNNLAGNEYGVYFQLCSNNTICGNNITNSNEGVILESSSDHIFYGNNSMSGNEYNFGVTGNLLSHFVHDVDSSNIVDGKPIYYWVNQQNMEVPSDAGHVVLVNSDNITAKGLELRNNRAGLLLANTSESKITDNNMKSNRAGIQLYWSFNNTVTANNITENDHHGFYLYGSSSNVVSANNITDNVGLGIYLRDNSNNNMFYENNVIGQQQGFRVEISCSLNTFLRNNITDNWIFGFYSTSSWQNAFFDNIVKGNGGWGTVGIYLASSSFNTILRNNISNYDSGVYLYWASTNNTFSENNIADNHWCASLNLWGYQRKNNFYHNNFMNNTQQVRIVDQSDYVANFWDFGYPGGGNYWSNYYGLDVYSCPTQDELGSDGIGDTPYIIGINNYDNYPLMDPWTGEQGVLNVWPNYGGNTETETLTVLGRFSNVTSLKLVREGCTDIEGSNTTVTNNFLISSKLNLTDRELGLWDLVVLQADAQELRLEDAFTICERRVSAVYPRTLCNSTRETVHVSGLGFAGGMMVELRRENASQISTETVMVSSPNMIVAHFNLNNTPSGTYDLAVVWPDSYEEIISSGIEIIEIKPGSLSSPPEFHIPVGNTISYDFAVPEVNDLFVTLQKTSLVSYGNSWSSEMLLLHGAEEIASTSGSHDLILHIMNPEPGTYTVNIRAHQSGSGILTMRESLPALPQGRWMVGTVYCSYGSVWYQLEVPPNKNSLFLEAEAMGIWSHFNIYHEEYDSSNRWVSPQGTRTSIEIPNPDPGTYIVEFTDSAMLYGDYSWSEDQTRDVLIKAETTFSPELPPDYLPFITSLSTDRAGNTGFVTIDIRGGWLDPNATVALVHPNREAINAQDVYGTSDGTALTVLFDLVGKEAGEWSLNVTNADGQCAVAPSLFTIEESAGPEVWAEIVGREKIRAGRNQTYILRCGNPSSVDVNDALLWIDAPSQWQVQIDLPPSSEIPENPQDLTSCIWIPKLPAKTTSEFLLHISSQEVEDGEIKVGLAIPTENQGIQGGQWYPPNECPPVGSVVIRLSNYGLGPGHVGIVVGDNWEVVDLVIDNFFLLSYKVNKPFDLRTKWYDGVGGEGMYLGAWVFPGWTREKGLQIADYAKGRADSDETGNYWLVPIKDNTKNCITFVAECLKHVGINPKWCALTTPASIYERLSGQLWPEFRWGLWVLAPSSWESGLGDTEYEIFFRWLKYKLIKVIYSTTPEDKYGPTGFDLPGTPEDQLKRFVSPDQNFYYKIDFWNMENATAPACDVYVIDQLDSDLNWSRLRLEEFGFLKWIVKLEPCQYFNVYVDTRPQMDLIVNIEGMFDPDTGEISWVFRSLDPITMETPDDPAAGFLPPITEGGNEVGWVCFSVDPKTSLPNGTRIENQAFVNFDGVGPYNPAPKEGPFVNTIETRNIAVVNIVSMKTVVGQGHNVFINVTVANEGSFTETFNVTLYANTAVVETQTVGNLSKGTSAILSFNWNTTDFGKGNYTLSAHAEILPIEVDTTDNTCMGNWIIVSTIGDITGPDGWPDGKCDIRDIALVAKYFGQTAPPAPPTCDITGPIAGVPDGKIDIRDIATVAIRFGQVDP